jgi:hypothetical protein
VDDGFQALVVTMKAWDARSVDVELVAHNLETGTWTTYIDGTSRVTGEVSERTKRVKIEVQACGDNKLERHLHEDNFRSEEGDFEIAEQSLLVDGSAGDKVWMCAKRVLPGENAGLQALIHHPDRPGYAKH